MKAKSAIVLVPILCIWLYALQFDSFEAIAIFGIWNSMPYLAWLLAGVCFKVRLPVFVTATTVMALACAAMLWETGQSLSSTGAIAYLFIPPYTVLVALPLGIVIGVTSTVFKQFHLITLCVMCLVAAATLAINISQSGYPISIFYGKSQTSPTALLLDITLGLALITSSGWTVGRITQKQPVSPD